VPADGIRLPFSENGGPRYIAVFWAALGRGNPWTACQHTTLVPYCRSAFDDEMIRRTEALSAPCPSWSGMTTERNGCRAPCIPCRPLSVHLSRYTRTHHPLSHLSEPAAASDTDTDQRRSYEGKETTAGTPWSLKTSTAPSRVAGFRRTRERALYRALPEGMRMSHT